VGDANFKIHTVSLPDIVRWEDGADTGSTLPEAHSISRLWFTLRDGDIISSSEQIIESRDVVVILHQMGVFTHPEAVWPAFARFYQRVLNEHACLHLVLTGGATLRWNATWRDWLVLATPDDPPVRDLLAEVLISGACLGRTRLVGRLILRLVRALWR